MPRYRAEELKSLLDEAVEAYNRPGFIEADPVSVPHRFQKLQDREIAGLLTATLAWGQRKTIISKSLDLMARMDNAPHDFLLRHEGDDLRVVETFIHRTFNGVDARYFLEFLSWFYRNHGSLEEAFAPGFAAGGARQALSDFHRMFFGLPQAPVRTRKHMPPPERDAACKRLNMFLRWMVRRDDKGVDFGCWTSISPALLICPLDMHVERVARKLGLLRGRMKGWETGEQLTARLRKFDPQDPVKYDFALFGLGVMEKF